MPRHGRRLKVAPNVYRDDRGFEVQLCVHGQRVSKSFDLETPLRVVLAWRDRRRRALERRILPASRATLRADVARFVRSIRYLRSWKSIASHLSAWEALYGDWPRHRIAEDEVRQAYSTWAEAGVAPKTIRNRRQALQQLFHVLDGKDGDGRPLPTPVDDVEAPAPPRPMPIAVDAWLIREVAANLYQQELAGRLRDATTRARFLVLAASGRRKGEVEAIEPRDVDLERRVWRVRDAKGGYSDGIYLNDDLLAAFELFFACGATGAFDARSFARRLRWCGWPPDVRPYNLRHSVGIALSDAGVDLADVQAWMGHRHIATTRAFYVPVRGGRLQRASEQLTGRLGPVLPIVTPRSPKRRTG